VGMLGRGGGGADRELDFAGSWPADDSARGSMAAGCEPGRMFCALARPIAGDANGK